MSPLRPRFGFRARLVAVQLLTLLLLVSALVLAAMRAGRETIERATAEKVESLGHLIGSQVVLDLSLEAQLGSHMEVDLEDMRALLAGLEDDPAIGGVTVYGADRRPLLGFRRDGDRWLETVEAPVEAPLLPDAPLVHLVADVLRYDAPIAAQGKTVGWLSLGATLLAAERLEDAQRGALLAASAAGLLVTAAIGVFLAGHVTRSVAALSEAAVRIGQGERGVRVPEAGADELGLLSRTFNSTMGRLEAATDALATSNASLADANRQLEGVNAEMRAVNARLESTVAQLARTNSTLERRNKELEEFAYVASHDLQSPLRAISRFSQLVVRKLGEGLDAEGREFLAFIVDGTVRMQALIDDLLDYSRVTRTEAPLEVTPLGSLVDVALKNLSADVADSGGQVVVAELPAVAVDAPQLKRLFQNLVGNALKYRRDDVPPRIEVSAAADEAGWVVSVADNGIGIAPRHAQRVFGIFKRLHGRESKYKGTGIGLAICAKIVERHGGRIWVDQPPEGSPGTIFRFTLPSRTEQGAARG